MVKTIIFDMDGTLFQTSKILATSLEDTFDYLRSLNLWNEETPLEKYNNILGAPLPEVWKTLLPNHDTSIHELSNIFFLERLIENIKLDKGALYPFAIETLTYLIENHYQVFIASNGLTKYLEAIVQHYHLDQWITETFSIEQVNSLNKSDLVRHILDKYQIKHAIVVGDRLSDINAAKDNALMPIGCRFEFSKDEELAHAPIIIDSLFDLKNILSQL